MAVYLLTQSVGLCHMTKVFTPSLRLSNNHWHINHLTQFTQHLKYLPSRANNSSLLLQKLRQSLCQIKFRKAKLFIESNSAKRSSNKCLVYAFAVPAFFTRFTFHNKTIPSGTLSPEILAKIPKEVFHKDTFKHQKRGWILRSIIRIWLGFRYWLRFGRILLTFVPLLCIYPVACICHSLKVRWWKTLLCAMESTGPAFIKLGQWASTRRDLFSAEFCDLFSRLHDDSRTHSWRMTKKKMLKAFGKKWRDIFIQLEKEPIGSGCIAQVHKGYMATDMIPDEGLVTEMLEDMEDYNYSEVDFAEGAEIMGFHTSYDQEDDSDGDLDSLSEYKSRYRIQRESSEAGEMDDDPDSPPLIPVAVKVLHPGVYVSVTRDLAILEMLTRTAETILPRLRWLSLHECMHEFATLLTKQIDLRFEAECLDQFVENFESIPNVRFPKPVRPYCKRDVLVETFEEGVPIANFLNDNVEYPEGLREKIAQSGVEALLQMVFVDNFVHGDLHPGNILVQNASSYVPPQEDSRLMLVDVGDTMIVDVQKSPDPIRLVLLDVGITSSLSLDDFDNLRKVFTAVVLGEGERVAELMLQHARYSDCHDVRGFKKELGQIVQRSRNEALSLSKVQVGKLLSDVFTICTRYRVQMESNFASIMLAILVLEGLGRSLDPNVDILDIAKPILLGTSVSS